MNPLAPQGQGGPLDFKIKRGLDLPITGAPEQQIESGPEAVSCAVIGDDFLGLKPKMIVAEGDRVERGQVLFSDRRFDGVVYTAPAGGVVRAINRGARRVLQSVVIDIDESGEGVSFAASGDPDSLDRDRVKENLLASGLWTALRTRPYSKVPDPATAPAAVFVTAMDSGPLAPDAAVVVQDAAEDFSNGVKLLSKLTGGKTYVCARKGSGVPRIEGSGIEYATFEGPHPSGLVGTHIHFLDPVSAEKSVWYMNYQDAIAVGRLFRTGHLDCGPCHLPSRPGCKTSAPAADTPRRSRIGLDPRRGREQSRQGHFGQRLDRPDRERAV